jgi:hypothetical protein
MKISSPFSIQRLLFLACAVLLFASCGGKASTTTTGSGGSGGEGELVLPESGSIFGVATVGSDGTVVQAIGADGAPVPPTGALVMCGDHLCACNDGLDNDNDGNIDGQDIACVDARDDDEANLGLGYKVGGDNSDLANKQDCFFDGDSGSGNDGCEYDAICWCPDVDNDGYRDACTIGDTTINRPLKPRTQDCDPSKPSDPSKCAASCGPYIPNGCDALGCCEIYRADGSSFFAVLTPECVPETGQGCMSCQQNDATANDCGECELCIGKSTVPATCSGAEPGGYTCEGGQPSCSAENPCTSGLFCSLGCCMPIPVI